jgi:hypothetical protein
MPYVPSSKTPGHIEKYGQDDRKIIDAAVQVLADAIATVAAKYKYDGAFLGELNYAETRLIQEIPRSLMKTGQTKEETRYWIQAGLMGVQLDVILEYKLRTNQAYEFEQRVKSGDCYDGPYYSRAAEVVDGIGKHVGYQEVHLKRSVETLDKDVLPGKIVLA